jgi:signal transduction histidine kinase
MNARTKWALGPTENRPASLVSIGGPRATSQSVALPVLLLLSFNSSPTGLPPEAVGTMTWLFAVLAAFAGTWAYFSLVGAWLDRVFPERSTQRYVAVLVLFATTEMLRTTLTHSFALAWGIQSSGEWVFRLVSAAATGLALFGSLSIVLNDFEAYRGEYRRLVEQRWRLQISLSTSEDNLAATRSQLFISVRSRLEDALLATLAESRKVSPSDAKVVDELFRVAEEVVRPLSHELFDVPVKLDELPRVTRVPHVRFRTLLSDASKAPFRPFEMLVLVALLAVPVMMLSTNYLSLLSFVVALVFVFVIHWTGQRCIEPRLGSIPLGWRVLLLTVVFAVPAVVLAIAVFSFVPVPVPVPVPVSASAGGLYSFFLYGVILAEIMSWLMAFVAGIGRSRHSMLREAATLNDELFWHNVRTQSQLWVEQKDLAITLHNDVHTTLIAAALQLRMAMEAGSPAIEAMPDVRRLISRALHIATTEVQPRDPHEMLSRANDRWGGLITASWALAPKVSDLLRRDSVALRIIEDFLVEFMTNSIKHGRANAVRVELAITGERTFELSMTNNGSPIDNDRLFAGLGSRLLGALTLEHSLIDVQGGVRLTVSIPFSAQERKGGKVPLVVAPGEAGLSTHAVVQQ